ncbi:MAG: hypothetical protein GY845_11345 [Planctomycetes bacterium]|nr:hypothetical protein [Planctomycetota bacterium]
MDNSTDGVTLYAGFISDLLANYQSMETVTKELFKFVKDTDLSDPTAPVPIKLYNDMCDWIERNLGPANLRAAGEAIGARAYNQMIQSNNINSDSTPQEILQALKAVADFMIQDPLGRGWTILEMGENRAVMRRTQTFHPVLQEGLLRSLVVQSSKVTLANVKYLASVRKGDEFDEYEVTWL